MRARKIHVCADDAGWREADDACLLALAREARISAISLLVDGESASDWRRHSLPSSCSLGLHFQLNWTADAGSQGLLGLIARSQLRMVSKVEIEARLQSQLAHFETLAGCPPDFVDGHQHVHMFPVVREVLLRVLDARYGRNARPAVRSTCSTIWRGRKAALINLLGGKDLHRELCAGAWHCNQDFAGIYDFSGGRKFPDLMRAWLGQLPDGGMIMVHPGSADHPEHGRARAAEAAYLESQGWRDDVAANELCLAAFSPERV